jgi:hypothetical protein
MSQYNSNLGSANSVYALITLRLSVVILTRRGQVDERHFADMLLVKQLKGGIPFLLTNQRRLVLD